MEINSSLTGNRICNLKELTNWASSSFNCKECHKGYPCLIDEKNIQGLSSVLIWKCFYCHKLTKVPTSPMVKMTHTLGEKPKAVVNIRGVQGTILGGGTYKSLDAFCGALDIPSMSHKTYDTIGYKTLKSAYDVALLLCRENVKEERNLTLLNGGTIDKDNRVHIKGSYDGNWAKRSYRFTYNSLVGAGCLIGYYTGLPLWFAVKNKDCSTCANEKRRGKKAKQNMIKDYDCFRNWDAEKSAKAMEPAIAVEICLELSKLEVLVKVIIGDEDASTLKQIHEQLEAPLNEVTKESDINHIKRNLTTKINSLKQNKYSDKKYKLTAVILHLVTNFGYALKTHQNRPIEAGLAIHNVIPHSFGNHTFCDKVGNGIWCKAKDPTYKPGFKGGKYLGATLSTEEQNTFQQDLQQIFDDFTTVEMLQKLAPCGSSQKNEALHSMVISLASKSLHFGCSNSYL